MKIFILMLALSPTDSDVEQAVAAADFASRAECEASAGFFRTLDFWAWCEEEADA